MIGASGVALDDHRADDTVGVKTERMRERIHCSVQRPARSTGAVLQPVVEKLVGISAGKRGGLRADKPDALLEVVEGDVGRDARIQSIQASQIKCWALTQAELGHHAFDERGSEGWLWDRGEIRSSCHLPIPCGAVNPGSAVPRAANRRSGRR